MMIHALRYTLPAILRPSRHHARRFVSYARARAYAVARRERARRLEQSVRADARYAAAGYAPWRYGGRVWA